MSKIKVKFESGNTLETAKEYIRNLYTGELFDAAEWGHIIYMLIEDNQRLQAEIDKLKDGNDAISQ